jgi:chemotaxis protein CheZ
MRSDEEFAAFLRAEIADGVSAAIGEQLAELRRFVDRRFAEVSAEVNATATLGEMSEAALSAQIAKIQHEVGRMVARPMAETRTSGIELEAVVQGTETAANQIMEAAEAIQDCVGRDNTADSRVAILEMVQTIFEACSFQDLTSQRIRRAIRHLQQVDLMLNSLASADPAPVAEDPCTSTGADLNQALIDELLGGCA